MPIIKGWGKQEFELDWETDQVAFLYDSRPGPEYFMFPMTGLLPINQPTSEDIAQAPAPLWITYLEPTSPLGKVDSKGDRTFRIELPSTFEEYLSGLSYDSRKEMRYILRKCEHLVAVENQKADLLAICDSYFDKINERAIQEGEKPFTAKGIAALKEIFKEDCVHTISFFEADVRQPVAVNVSFRKEGIVYDSFCIRSERPDHKKMSLGTLAILKNVEMAIRDGYRVYDMLTGDWGYKSKFGAVATPLKMYVKCSKEFAQHYQIPLEDVAQLVP